MKSITNPGDLEYADEVIYQLQAENAILKELVKAAICPECDGSGIIAQQVGEQEWEPIQCQWCDTRNQILGEEK